MRRSGQTGIRWILSIGMLCICLSGCGEKSGGEVFETVEEAADGDARELQAGSGEKETADGTEAGQPAQTQEMSVVQVYVCGQVACPGVYSLEEGARVADALEEAGGVTAEAAEEFLNLAMRLADGQKIYVPSREETASRTPADGMTADTGSGGTEAKINLNTATRQELMTLSGIGEARADGILAYRQEQGPFQSIEEIKNVSGIGEGIFSRIKDRITV